MASDSALTDVSRVPQIVIGTLVPSILGSIFVIARLYTRGVITRNWGTDDTLILIAWIVGIAMSITHILFTCYGMGHHEQFNPPSDIIPTMKLAYSSRLIYQFVLFCTKLGLCFFYLRIFQDRTSKHLIYSIILFLVITFIPVELVVIFQCHPVNGAWSLQPAKCIDNNPGIYASAAFNIFADVILMAFVLPRIVPLKMARRQKASLLAVVSLGVLVIIAAIVRLVRTIQSYKAADLPWNGYDITTWSAVEVYTGLFCASAPCIRPLLRQIAPGLLSSLSQTVSGPVSQNQRTKTKSFMHGTGTHRSVLGKKDINAFELSSQSEKGLVGRENGKGRELGTSSFCGGGAVGSRRGSGSDGDDGSEKGIFERDGDGRRSAGLGDIVKTVSVTVTGGAARGDESEMSRENSIVRFEHV